MILLHRVSIPDPRTHVVHVETTVVSGGELPDSLTLFMPVWTPGSYKVRDYARILHNPSSLPHDYTANLLVVVAAVWAGALVITLVRR